MDPPLFILCDTTHMQSHRYQRPILTPVYPLGHTNAGDIKLDKYIITIIVENWEKK